MREFFCPEGHDPTKVYLHIEKVGRDKFVIWDCYLPSDKFWVGGWVLRSSSFPEFRPSSGTLFVWGEDFEVDCDLTPIWELSGRTYSKSSYREKWREFIQALKDSDKVVLKMGEGERPPTLEEDFFADVV